jgi:hypothetical protein
VESVENLSTIFVDNLSKSNEYVESVEKLFITVVDTSKEVKKVKRKRVIHKQCG